MMQSLHRTKMTIEQIQDLVGLLDTDEGIITLSIKNTDMETLLAPYLESADYKLYYDFCDRILFNKYAEKAQQGAMSFIYKSIYHTLKSNLYNLKTLINSTELEYDPIENYFIKEKITTTASIVNRAMTIVDGTQTAVSTTSYSSFVNTTTDNFDTVKVDQETSREEHTNTRTLNHGAVEKTFSKDESDTTGSQTDILTRDIGEQSNTSETIVDHGAVTKTGTKTDTIGARTTNDNAENKVSAYNTNTYQPSNTTTSTNSTESATDSSNTSETTNTYMDTTNTTDTTGQRQDKDTNVKGERIDKHTATNTETTPAYVDTEILKESPYNDHDIQTTDPREDTHSTNFGERDLKENRNVTNKDTTNQNSNRNDDINRDRELHGRYGFTTVQSMIDAERNLANLSIVDLIVNHVIHVISEGVLYTW